MEPVAQQAPAAKAASTTPKIVEVNVTVKRSANHRIHEMFYAESKLEIGAAFDGTAILTGLSMEEELRLMPPVVNLEANHPEFRNKVNEYWKNFTVVVPVSGRKLNASYDEIVRDGKTYRSPHNINDFIAYGFLSKHPLVSPSLDHSIGNKQTKAYLEDAGVEKQKLMTGLTLKKEVRKKVIALTEENKFLLLKAILEMLKVDGLLFEIIPTDEDGLLALVDKYSEAYPAEFLKYAKDANIQDRALVYQLINKRIISSVNNEIYDESVGTSAVASSIDDYIKYFKDSKNTAYYNKIKTLANNK